MSRKVNDPVAFLLYLGLIFSLLLVFFGEAAGFSAIATNIFRALAGVCIVLIGVEGNRPNGVAYSHVLRMMFIVFGGLAIVLSIVVFTL